MGKVITVKDLVEQLSLLSPDLPVFVERQHMELGTILKSASITMCTYNSRVKDCRDAFDGTSYRTEIKERSYKENQGIKCVLL